MSTASIQSLQDEAIRPRKAGFVSDIIAIAGRAIRAIPREPEAVIPALIIPLFFFAVTTGALGNLAGAGRRLTGSYEAFQVPVAIIFAVTGISRAAALVVDIQGGYFDRLLMTPIRRLPLLTGLMVADLFLVVALTIPVLILGLALGVRFQSGIPGLFVFVMLAGAWGLAFAGFSYAIALKTGNPAAVNSSFILFFPFAFLTSAWAPIDFLSGWMQTVARYNPVTYVLDGLRSLLVDANLHVAGKVPPAGQAWDGAALGKAVIAIAIVAAISLTLSLLALRSRVNRS